MMARRHAWPQQNVLWDLLQSGIAPQRPAAVSQTPRDRLLIHLRALPSNAQRQLIQSITLLLGSAAASPMSLSVPTAFSVPLVPTKSSLLRGRHALAYSTTQFRRHAQNSSALRSIMSSTIQTRRSVPVMLTAQMWFAFLKWRHFITPTPTHVRANGFRDLSRLLSRLRLLPQCQQVPVPTFFA
jgi:hypothetical protein